MANTGTVRTAAELTVDKLLQNQFPLAFKYFARAEFDASPAATEIFLNGQEDNRIYLPEDSYMLGRLMFLAWNLTDGAGADVVSRMVDFGISNDSGTVSFLPANLSGTDGNPIVVRTSSPGSETAVLAADDTNNALRLNFTGEASKNYIVTARIDALLVSKDLKNPNFMRVSG